jgi:hypothetical protein
MIEVSPGGTATVQVRAVNAGDIVDDFEVSVIGADHPGITGTVERASLLPNREQTLPISIRVGGNGGAPPAGTSVVGIRVSSLSNPSVVRVEELRVTVAASAGASMSVEPELVKGGASARLNVVVANVGNVPLDVALRGHDPEGVVDFRFTPRSLSLPPGSRAGAAALVSAPRPFSGLDHRRLLTVHADGAPVPLACSATFVQRPRLSQGAVRVLGAALALAVVAGSLVAVFLANRDEGSEIATTGSPGSGQSTTGAGTGTSVAGSDEASTSTTAQAEQVSVPDTVGLSQIEAATALAQSGLVAGQPVESTSDTIDEGLVIATMPPGGTLLDPGTEVTLVVSSGPQPPPPVEVPDVVGSDEAAAKATIGSACEPSPCLMATITRDFSDQVAEGLVLSQNPAAGETVDTGSAVTVVVSLGPEIQETTETPATPFVGTWLNQDASTGGNTRFEIDEAGGAVVVHAYGKCHPSDCDWGIEVGEVDGPQATVAWDQGFVERTMTMDLLDDGRLEVSTEHRYADGRPDRSDEAFFVRMQALRSASG